MHIFYLDGMLDTASLLFAICSVPLQFGLIWLPYEPIRSAVAFFSGYLRIAFSHVTATGPVCRSAMLYTNQH